jgi:hypothetical protein
MVKYNHCPLVIALLILFIFFNSTISLSVAAEPGGSLLTTPIWKALHPEVSTDSQVVTFNFGSDVFEVPKNYIFSISSARTPNEPGAIVMELLLPDLSPRTPENEDRFNAHNVGHGDRMFLSIYYKTPMLKGRDIVLNSVAAAKGDINKFTMTSSGYKKYDLGWTEIYTKDIDNGNDLFFIYCTPEKLDIPKGCNAGEMLYQDISVIYYFNKKYQESSFEIDQKVRALVAGFRKTK